MILGIDASNLRYGGGVTHLTELLAVADPEAHGFDRVVVWGGVSTLDRIADRPWLTKVHERALDGNLAARTLWQSVELPRLLTRAQTSLLFAPGGTAPASARPRVVMCRNMLPFDPAERERYGFTPTRARLEVLRIAQARSFASADGVIFLTRHAFDAVRASMPHAPRRAAIVSHGINPRFLADPRPQRALSECSFEAPFRWLYVSTVTRYKHQWAVAEAMRALRAEGLPVAIEFAGLGDDARSVEALSSRLRDYDPLGTWTSWKGHLPFADIVDAYRRADAAVYASSCENMPNILLESMASGLPVACSERGPMPELIGSAATWFDPEDPRDIARAARVMLHAPALRARMAAEANAKARRFSWHRCADETFTFLRDVATSTAQAPR
jgi:glycosyltransferase involved in cell wall biosynthesis